MLRKVLPFTAVVAAAAGEEHLHTESLVPYFNYEGNLNVLGKVIVNGDDGYCTLQFDLDGVDPKCNNGPSDGVANSCGIHIHAGKSCEEDGKGHHFKDGEDPWKPISFTSEQGKASITEPIKVNDGFNIGGRAGHVLVVHDATGARVACGELVSSEGFHALHDEQSTRESEEEEDDEEQEEEQVQPAELDVESSDMRPRLIAKDFTPYFQYTGDISVSGEVTVTGYEHGQKLTWDLLKVDKECWDGEVENVKNSCGLHIHKGDACGQAVQGHFFSSELHDDPWATVSYKAVHDENTESDYNAADQGVMVPTQLTQAQVMGATVIVHDVEGNRIACAKLDEDQGYLV